MAWPPRRSSGRYSRRDRNLALLGRLATAAVVIVALALLVLNRADPERFAGLRTAAADLVAPFWKAVLTPFEGAQSAAGSAADYFRAIDKLRALQARERLFEEQRQRYEQARQENLELKRLLKVVEPPRTRVGVFAVSGSSSGAFVRNAMISGGRRHGVAPGQPVLAASGLIGRTLEVGENAARVMLITDVSSRVPVRVVRTGMPALVIGKNLPIVDVDLSGPTDADVRVGDRLVTSGDGGLFPPGLPVATIIRIGEDMPVARPAAAPDGLDYVIVETPFMPLPPPAEAERVRELHPEVAAQRASDGAP